MRSFRLAAATLAAVAGTAGSALAATSSLTSFLLRPGEETGFVVNGHQHATQSIHTWVTKIWGDSRKQAKLDSARLKAEGFVGGAQELTKLAHGNKQSYGLSIVLEFKTHASARREWSYLVAATITEQGGPVTYFKVPGVRGAKAFTARSGASGAANVFWVEGRCEFEVGDFRPGAGSLAGPVKAGAQAIHRRTHGKCP